MGHHPHEFCTFIAFKVFWFNEFSLMTKSRFIYKYISSSNTTFYFGIYQ